MKKSLFLLVITLVIYSCGSYKNSNTTTVKVNAPVNVTEFANTITSVELKEMLYTYASDEFESEDSRYAAGAVWERSVSGPWSAQLHLEYQYIERDIIELGRGVT